MSDNRKRDAVIVSALRTPVGRFAGALKDVPPEELGAVAMRSVIEQAGVAPSDVEDVIFGNNQAFSGNPARLASLIAGIPIEISAVTVDRACLSGLNAVTMAGQAIRCGDADIVVAGGMESMTRRPYVMEKSSVAYQRTPPEFLAFRLAPEEIGSPPMGITAENVADVYKISRDEMDEYGVRSHRLAVAAWEEGRFAEEVVPVSVPKRKGDPVIFSRDENPRADTSIEALIKLRPAFKKEGLVTAGNSSPVTDGAAAVLVMSREEAEKRGLTPMAKICAHTIVGVDPNIMGIGPAFAIPKLLSTTGFSISDFALVEINEAFASQVLACIVEMKSQGVDLDIDRLNVNGGAIAIGHPISSSGCRIVVTMLHELIRRKERYGLASICGGGGHGMAAVFENESL
jgi:acetyl-CoA C-acetyltransferase